MHLRFSGPLFEWRGPAPFYFVRVPDAEAGTIRAAARLLSYGWGVIPVTVSCGGTEWTTSLFPKGGSYLVPVKAAVQRAEGLSEGDEVALHLRLGR